MFQQITILTLGADYALPYSGDIEEHLHSQAFLNIGPTQQLSVGFVPPRGEESGALVEVVAGHYIMSVAIEKKSVPAKIVRAKVDEMAAQIEEQTGRKPGKKERRAMKDEALLALLPTAFPKRADIPVWIDPQTRRVVIGSASTSKLDEVVTALIQAIPDLLIQHLQTKTAPQAAMTAWLASPDDEWAPADFAVERECTLKSQSEDKAVVKFKNHHLGTDEVRQHITEGKLPTELGLSYDGSVSFVLTEGGSLKKINFLAAPAEGDSEADFFDANVALATGQLTPCIDALIEALGGAFEFDGEAA